MFHRRLEESMQLLEFKCVEFVGELIYRHLRKKPGELIYRHLRKKPRE